MGSNKLDDLPPLARATAIAMERPYRPGHKRRVILIGVVVVTALAALFLSRMPPSQPRATSTQRPVSDTGVVYQNLRSPVQALPQRRADVTAPAATESNAEVQAEPGSASSGAAP